MHSSVTALGCADGRVIRARSSRFESLAVRRRRSATGGHYYDCVHGTLIIIIAGRGAECMTIRSTVKVYFARAGVQVAPGAPRARIRE